MLISRPGFSLAAVAVLSLGIGANTAIFSTGARVPAQAVAVHNPGELAGCYSRDTRRPDYARLFYIQLS
jgi:hypothetical protein